MRRKKRLRDIPPEDRPREKFLRLGPSALNNEELLALVINKGSKKKDVLSLAREVLKLIEKDPEGVSVKDLKGIEGIGTVKAVQILAALFLARRLMIKDGIKILKASQLYHLNADLIHERQECLALITVDGSGRYIKRRILTRGTANRTLIHPREVFYHAIKDGAYGVFLVHNHPSGDTTPSQEDIAITDAIKRAGQVLGIPLLDHIIIGKRGFFSFKEQGLLDGNPDSKTG